MNLPEPPNDLLSTAMRVSLRRRLLSSSGWALFGRVATSLLGLGINAMLARLLSPGDFGAYFILLNLVLFGSTLTLLGMDRGIVRLVAAPLATGEPSRARAAIIVAFRSTMVATLLAVTVLVLGGGEWLTRKVFSLVLPESVIIAGVLWLAGYTFVRLQAETFRGLQQFKHAAIFDSLLVDLIVILFLGAWMIQGTLTATQVVLLFALATAAVAATAFVLILRRIRTVPAHGGPGAKEVLGVGLPLMVTNLSLFLLATNIDLWVVAAFRPTSEVAVYGAASRLLFFTSFPLLVLQLVVPPMIAELHAQGRKEQLERMLRGTATLAGVPALLGLLLLLLFGPWVLGLVYGPFYEQGGFILRVLAVARVVSVWAGTCGLALMMTGHQRSMMYISVVSGFLSVGGGLLLSARYGGNGVAVATAFTIALQTVLMLVTARARVGIWTNVVLRPKRLLGLLKG